ncbi:RBBP9/YdeN family alpha/beta hydrolase [Curtobacterium sp. VKM Ac-2887]|uniref:RBBP9/YdeN family alpha/beta hydrolase n=1 Tax=Curtobacterium sp. VKM Ac-2887 TaxID=2783819 RepID=UPI00188B88D6|nr:alpha/beta fold hydrolase [Curtobacterium sp. VKM Ac-2887]MBF4585912.1 alpha/beta hydrolase [Curtobacterium sp. VKM Ac-2887]
MSRPRPWVIVPGIWNSDAEHWQSVWQRECGDDAVRIAPASWGEPDPGDWRDAISRAVASCAEPPVLVAHSLGVLAVADWLVADAAAVAGAAGPTVAGAFLVAPPDPAAPGFPAAASGFPAPRPIPVGTAAARVPTRLVVSDDDPYCTADRALAFAETMGAAVLRVGPLGHVNVASGVGAWPAGRELLGAFERTL